MDELRGSGAARYRQESMKKGQSQGDEPEKTRVEGKDEKTQAVGKDGYGEVGGAGGYIYCCHVLSLAEALLLV